jgi:hypothetical protein
VTWSVIRKEMLEHPGNQVCSDIGGLLLSHAGILRVGRMPVNDTCGKRHVLCRTAENSYCRANESYYPGC